MMLSPMAPCPCRRRGGGLSGSGGSALARIARPAPRRNPMSGAAEGAVHDLLGGGWPAQIVGRRIERPGAGRDEPVEGGEIAVLGRRDGGLDLMVARDHL